MMKPIISNIKSRLGNNIHQRSLGGIHNRIGKRNSLVKKRLGLTEEPIIASDDVRNKLIAKKRNNILDARDRLAEIANQGDVRDKLNIVKTQQSSQVQLNRRVLNKSKNVVNFNGARSSGLNEKSASYGTLTRTVNGSDFRQGTGIRKHFKGNTEKTFYISTVQRYSKGSIGKPVFKPTAQRFSKGSNEKTFIKSTVNRGVLAGGTTTRRSLGGLATTNKSSFVGGALNYQLSTASTVSNRYHPIKSNPNVVTIKNERAELPLKRTMNNRSMRPVARPNRVNQAPPPPLFQERSPMFEVQRKNFTFEPEDGSSYQNPWAQPIVSNSGRPTQLRITTTNDYNMDANNSEETEYTYLEEEHPIERPGQYVPLRAPAVKRSFYDNRQEEEYTPISPKKVQQPPLSTHMISRLDESTTPHPGYKVMVSNLHSVVTLEDVEELFSNIGPLKSTRIVRDGIAEVYFISAADAFSSVEVYNNRQLDGRVMHVSVVAKQAVKKTSPPVVAATAASQLPSSASTYRQRLPSPSRDNFQSQQRRRPAPVTPSLPSPSRDFLSSQQRRRPAPVTPSSTYRQKMTSDRPATRSILRSAEGSHSHAHQSVSRKPRQSEVSPDIYAIKQALFNANDALYAANQQFRINVPKSYR